MGKMGILKSLQFNKTIVINKLDIEYSIYLRKEYDRVILEEGGVPEDTRLCDKKIISGTLM